MWSGNVPKLSIASGTEIAFFRPESQHGPQFQMASAWPHHSIPEAASKDDETFFAVDIYTTRVAILPRFRI